MVPDLFNNNDLPITNSVAEEIARLNTLSPRLLNPNLTYQQLLDLNISNFFKSNVVCLEFYSLQNINLYKIQMEAINGIL